ncbi:MAG: Gfo/Idh/MocA family oxidoreductase [Armatimonadota bacterium]
MKPLRFGIVGCGVISGTHGKALQTLQQDGLATLVVAADPNKERAEKFAEKFGGVACGSLDELLARDDIDAVTLCTPSGMHGKMAVQAAKAGKHVLSEKPLDVWIDAVDEAIAAAKAAGVVYGGIFQERFTADAQKLKRAIDSGAFGEIVLACAETKWYRSQDYYNTGPWRGTWELDAGVFSNQGIHSLDKVQWLAGEVVEVLSAVVTPGFHRKIEGETLGVVTVRYASGALGTLAMTTLSYKGFPERIDVSGTKGSGMLVGDHLAHFTTAEPFEESAAIATEGTGADNAVDKAQDQTAVGTEGHLSNIRDFPRGARPAGLRDRGAPCGKPAEYDLQGREGRTVCLKVNLWF